MIEQSGGVINHHLYASSNASLRCQQRRRHQHQRVTAHRANSAYIICDIIISQNGARSGGSTHIKTRHQRGKNNKTTKRAQTSAAYRETLKQSSITRIMNITLAHHNVARAAINATHHDNQYAHNRARARHAHHKRLVMFLRAARRKAATLARARIVLASSSGICLPYHLITCCACAQARMLSARCVRAALA